MQSAFGPIALAMASLCVALTGSAEPVSYLAALQNNKPPLQRYGSDPTLNRPKDQASRPGANGRRSISNERGPRGCRNNYNVDYLQLNLMWGPGFCRTSPRKCVVNPSNKFTVHGFWPQSNGQDNPEDCCFDNTFDYRDIAPLETALYNYWFSYYSRDSRSFWSHEWLKHGTCLKNVTPLQGEFSYFNTTLDLMARLNLEATLRKQNIVPNNSSPYSSAQIINAFKSLTGGKMIKIDCDKEHDQRIPVLTGINFCFDTKMAFIDCKGGGRCRDQVYLRQV